MADNKKIIIQVELQDDGTVNLKKLQKALDDVNKSQKAGIKVTEEKTKALRGTEAALLAEIKALKADRAANANTIPAYQKATVAITKVEDKLRKLTEARNKDVQVNAQFISNQGLASNSIVEFGRLISDAPFGIIGVTNNISQLGNQLGTLSRKTGSTKASFDILIKQLKSGGALILGFQVLISLITLYRDEITGFFTGTAKAEDKLEDFRDEIKETNQALTDAHGFLASLERYAQISEDLNSSEEERLFSLNKLKDEGYDPLTGSLDEFLKAKRRIAIFNATESVMQDEEKILLEERIRLNRELASLEEEKALKIKQGQEANIEGTLAVTKIKIKETKNLLIANEEQIDKSSQEIVDAFKKTSEELKDNPFYNLFIGTEDDDDPKKGTRRPKAKLFDFDDDVAGRLGRLYQDIEAELEKRDSDADTVKRERFRRLVGLPTAEEQKDALSEFLGIQKERIDGENQEHENKLKRIEKERQEQLKGITDRKKAEEKLAQMLMAQVSKLASIQNQAFQGTITRLNSERDIILNNDNLTSSEKDRLLKENDKKSRAVKIQQIKFQRDMFQIEAAMEIAKLTMAANGVIFNIGAAAAAGTATATSSIGRFLTDLGPIKGPIAFGVMIGGVLAQISSARKKANQQIKALAGPLAGVNSGGSGGGSAPIQAPAFNVVGATQESQLAQTIAESEEKPLRAYVVASDVSTAQELERSTIEGASIG